MDASDLFHLHSFSHHQHNENIGLIAARNDSGYIWCEEFAKINIDKKISKYLNPAALNLCIKIIFLFFVQDSACSPRTNHTISVNPL